MRDTTTSRIGTRPDRKALRLRAKYDHAVCLPWVEAAIRIKCLGTRSLPGRDRGYLDRATAAIHVEIKKYMLGERVHYSKVTWSPCSTNALVRLGDALEFLLLSVTAFGAPVAGSRRERTPGLKAEL